MNTTTTTPAAQPSKSFQVRDEAGRIWPPGFRSELFHPLGRHCVLTPKECKEILAAEKSAAKAKTAP